MRLWTYGFGALFLSAGGALFLTQCGDSNLGTPGDFGGDAAAGCPTNPPTGGTACSLPSGTTCNNYPQPGCECCGEVGATCENGTWQALAAETPNSGGSNIAPACPVTLPEAGSTCAVFNGGGCGAQPEQDCSFNCPQGGQLYAICGGGSWQISGSCDDDGGLDGGLDGGDGG